MLALVMLALVGAQPVRPPAVEFDTIALEEARRLDGTQVTITFVVGRPTYTWVVNGALRTIAGPAELKDEQERTAYLRGDRWKLREGKRVRATGVVRVIHHEAASVTGVAVPAWDEIRFEEE